MFGKCLTSLVLILSLLMVPPRSVACDGVLELTTKRMVHAILNKLNRSARFVGEFGRNGVSVIALEAVDASTFGKGVNELTEVFHANGTSVVHDSGATTAICAASFCISLAASLMSPSNAWAFGAMTVSGLLLAKDLVFNAGTSGTIRQERADSIIVSSMGSIDTALSLGEGSTFVVYGTSAKALKDELTRNGFKPEAAPSALMEGRIPDDGAIVVSARQVTRKNALTALDLSDEILATYLVHDDGRRRLTTLVEQKVSQFRILLEKAHEADNEESIEAAQHTLTIAIKAKIWLQTENIID